MSADVVGLRAIRTQATVEKWNPGRSPEDGPPDEVVITSTWDRPNGEPITDPAEISALEARAAAQTAGRE